MSPGNVFGWSLSGHSRLEGKTRFIDKMEWECVRRVTARERDISGQMMINGTFVIYLTRGGEWID